MVSYFAFLYTLYIAFITVYKIYNIRYTYVYNARLHEDGTFKTIGEYFQIIFWLPVVIARLLASLQSINSLEIRDCLL